ncbi:MAG: hypothetical protein V3V14_01515 [Saprospiraceae bacterium]
MNDIELIDAYLRKELSEKEALEVDNRIGSDEVFSALYKEHIILKEGIRYNQLKEKHALLKKMEVSASTRVSSVEKRLQPKVKSTKVISFLKFAVAAIGLLLVGYFGFYSTQSQQINQYASVFEDSNFDHYIHHKISRSTKANGLSRAQLKAYSLYANKNFELANPLLKTLWKTERDTLAYYYLGISHLGLNQIEKAKKILSNPALKQYQNPLVN